MLAASRMMACNTRLANWPGRSRLTRIAFLPQLSSSSLTACASCGSVLSPTTTSTSGTRCAGNQKCAVTARSGRAMPAAISVMRRPEVLERMGTSGGRAASSRRNRACFCARSSTMASMRGPHPGGRPQTKAALPPPRCPRQTGRFAPARPCRPPRGPPRPPRARSQCPPRPFCCRPARCGPRCRRP